MSHAQSDTNEAQFAQWNESMAQKYNPEDYHRSTNPCIRWIERRRVRAIMRLLQCQEHHSVLEVGVGAGNILEMVKSNQKAGIDLSPFLLQKARERLGDGVELIEGNAERLTDYYQPQSFDRIFCSEVLEHVQNPELVVAQMAKCVKPDGNVVVSVPNEGLINRLKATLKRIGIFRLIFPTIADHMEDEWHLHEFDKQLLQKVCAPSMRIAKITAAPFRWLPIRYIALLKPLA